MKLPSYVVVFGQKIKVETVELDDRLGGLFFTEGRIQINSNLPKEFVSQVFLHEFFHACISRCSLDQRMTLDLEEMLVDLLSKALTENFDIKPKIKR